MVGGEGTGSVPSGDPGEIDGGGARHNGGKPRLDLLCPLFLLGVGRVLAYGARKYANRNWERGNEWGVPIASMMRHLAAFMAGEDIDPESGLPHVDHIGFNAMQLSRNFYTYQDGDDRSAVLRSEATREALRELLRERMWGVEFAEPGGAPRGDGGES